MLSVVNDKPGMDLEDLIDGMNLTIEWGEENLDLSGTVDYEYGLWRSATLRGCSVKDLPSGQVPGWCRDPPKRREEWMRMASTGAKRNRQGFKYNPSYETRFWRRGRDDPRTRWEKFP